MEPLIIFFAAVCLSMITIKITRGVYGFAFAGRISLSAMLLLTAVGHFAFTRGMSLMLPGFIPFKAEIVYVTGFIEILFAVGLLLPHYRTLTAWALIIFLVSVLPANIYASIKQLTMRKQHLTGTA